MSKAPSMPMYWDAYLADTTHLTTEEHGAYMLLLGAMWRRNGRIPDDDKDIARILGMTVAKWKRTKERLSAFLTFSRGEITQQNLLKIWENTQEKIAKNKHNGSLGGRPKSNKNNEIGLSDGYVSQNPIKTISEPEPKDTIVSSAGTREDAADFSQKQNLDLKDLTKKLTEAANGKIQPHGSLVVGMILELINNGVDLETDILPTIAVVSGRMSKPASSWAYFVGAIREAYNSRIKAGEGLAKPTNVTKLDIFALPKEAQEQNLAFQLEQARLHRRWNPLLGPMPWQDGCRIPEHLLKPDDGKGWHVMGMAA